MRDELTFAKQKNTTKRLYDQYLKTDLVLRTEDSLGPMEINRIVREVGIAWYDVRDRTEKLAQFWDRVEDEHWGAL